MNGIERRKFNLFRRVNAFGETHVADFPAESLAGSLFSDLGRIIADLARSGAGQLSTGGTNRASGTTKAATRKNLRRQLVAISRTAKLIGKQVPGVADKFRLPLNNADQTLLMAADAFAKDAPPYRDLFVSHEMSVGFLDELNTARIAFDNAVRDRTAATLESIAVNRGVNAGISQGIEAVRRLDVLIRNKYRNDPATLAAWASVSHLERTTRQTPKTKTDVPAA